jgi:hypothetical protein
MNIHPARVLAACAALVLAAPAPAAAQSDVLLQLRSGSPAGDRFRIDSAGGFVAIGILGIGTIPHEGSGERLMWHPYKGAFRAGSIGSGGTYWDDSNVGFYTWAGGYNTTATGLSSFAMGYQSRATGSYSTAFGYLGNATGTGSVAIGYRSTADASYAIAIGQRASANGHTGAFVISDASTTDSTEASANNQFSGRFAGGWRLFTNSSRTTGVTLSAGGSSWSVVSDRHRKENFFSLDGEDVLVRLRAVPVSRWQYRDEEDRATWHVGPMAQDWHAAFALSDDPRTINMSDFDGVNLAAIQALERRTAEQAERIRELEDAARTHAAEQAALEARLRRLEALLGTSAAP